MRVLEIDRAREVVESGAVRPASVLVGIATAAQPGGKALGFEYGEDEENPGRYLLAVEVEDAAGDVWYMELDAQTGEVLESRNTSE